MSFLQGVTSFLESVDKKAGEIAESQRIRGGAHLDGKSPSDEEVDSFEEEDFVVDPEESSKEQPQPIAVGGDEQVRVDRLVQSLLTTQRQMEKRHEEATLDRERRFDALQRNYDALDEFSRASSEKVAALSADLERARNELLVEKRRADEHKSLREHQEEEAARLRDEVAMLADELQRVSANNSSLTSEVQVLRDERRKLSDQCHQAASELTDYRNRSKHLLDERDKRIAELEQQSLANSGAGGSTKALLSPTVEADLEASKSTIARLEAVCAEQELHLQEAAAKCTMLQQQRSRLECQLGALEVEKDEIMRAQEGYRNEVRDTHYLFDSERRAHSETRQKLKDVAEELEQLKRIAVGNDSTAAAKKPSVSDGGAAASELRLRELAELLMEKQAALEAKRSEADQWRTRFEVSQQRLREAELLQNTLSSSTASSAMYSRGGAGARGVYLQMGEHQETADGGDLSKNRFLGELSRKGPWGAKVVNVAQNLDRVSLRTGTFLKKNSLFRLGIIVYVLLLHFWVFFAVTLSSSMPTGRAEIGPKM